MSTGRVAVANLAGVGSLVGPFSGSDVHVETSNFLPSFALGIPLPGTIPAGGGEETQSGRLGPSGDQTAIVEAGRMPTPTTPPSASRSPSTSSTSSSSFSAATADTSLTSDTNHHLDLTPDNKDTQEEHKGVENQNDVPASIAFISEANADTDGIKHLHTANTDTTTTSSTLASTTTTTTTPPPSVPTAVSSSTTSLPIASPSSSLSTSTSPSVINLNDSQHADPNGLLSLLRPSFRSNPNLNVKFAPLPELAPRKRKSAIPLGMAARSQLAQRRRMMYQERYDYHGEYDDPSTRPSARRYMTPPDISEENEGVDGSGKAKKKAKKKKGGEDAAATGQQQQEQDGEKHKKSKDEDLEDMPGDPFVFLARKMGKAGKHFWKKVAQGGAKGGEKGGVGEESVLSENVGVVAVPVNGEVEGPQTATSEKLGDGEQEAKGATEPEAVLPDHERSLPDMQPLSLDESPIAEEEEGGEETEAVPKVDAADSDKDLIDFSTPVPHPTAAS